MARKPSSESSFPLQQQATVRFGAMQSTVLSTAATLIAKVFLEEFLGAATV